MAAFITSEPAVPFTIAETADEERRSVVIATGYRQLVFGYERVAREQLYGNASRVFLRTFHQPSPRQRAIRR